MRKKEIYEVYKKCWAQCYNNLIENINKELTIEEAEFIKNKIIENTEKFLNKLKNSKIEKSKKDKEYNPDK